ncbi:hypothetical protein QTJ16_001103 [Diplocarpon rosae]|uniref:Uncharacterized protein n=1 Tax=Diplocarpon rosae TaxID=946125 RepID=A0AAD9T7B7_9HELO|nr:hypothetical protein QTJ16_001103 [Diplocarpon rosae]PBP28654.1 conserved fungal protein [Diplocarpon rosae]
MDSTDMDIEMDIDMGLTEEDLLFPEVDSISEPQLSSLHPQQNLNTPNDTSGSDASELTPQKVHLRGLDNLTTQDIRDFASEYFGSHRPVSIDWIDDTSANIVYKTFDIGKAALVAFAAVDITDVSQVPTLQTIPAKVVPRHPETKLVVRLAVAGDRKQAGARERSRFYLFNPGHDPAERRKYSNRGPRTYRDRDDGGYRSQRYDNNEQEKREREADFDSSLYDDDEAAIARRRTIRQGSSSGSETRGRETRGGRYSRAAGKELFPAREDRGAGRLRNRSASPNRGQDGDQEMVEARIAKRRQRNNDVASANRIKAQAIKARLVEASATKELFPQKLGASHRRLTAFDAADETADLFADRMPVPFIDGSEDARPRGGILATRINGKGIGSVSSGFSIRGSALAQSSQGFSIKGTARVKELFPDNSGKELFSEKLEGRGHRRQRAEDLFS